MALEQSDLTALRRPFEADEHEFIQEFVYIKEEAVCNRLEEVDPGWQFEIVDLSTSGEHVVVRARMTVSGVTREGVGMQKINAKAGEAQKGAATDALKRCARLFGVGRYLLGAPPQNRFKAWLASLSNPGASIQQAAKAAGATMTKRENADAQDDLTNRDTAADFMNATRKAGIPDDTVLSILGVSKLSEWTQGRKAAGQRVKEWQTLQTGVQVVPA